jgi:hypothetical protein
LWTIGEIPWKSDSFQSLCVTLPNRRTWNDLINQKDYGPTFGARLTLDMLHAYERWWR